VDVPQFPGQQDAQEQQNGKTNPQSQGFGHATGFGLAMATVAHHVKKGSAQTAQNGNEGDDNDVFHGIHLND
jgi:hypothetical protein